MKKERKWLGLLLALIMISTSAMQFFMPVILAEGMEEAGPELQQEAQQNNGKYTVTFVQNSPDGGSIVSNTITMKSGEEGQEIPNSADPIDFEESKKQLSENTERGETNIYKNAYIRTEEDANEGIINTVIDVVGKSFSVDPIDVQFVIDISGSMNMWGNASDAILLDLVPDLNQEHYYKIPQGILGAKQDVYVQISDFPKIDNWTYLEADWFVELLNKCEEKNYSFDRTIDFKNEEERREALIKWQPWDHLYKLDLDHYVHLGMPRFSTQNGVFYYSPVGEKYANYDCYDRMIIQMAAVTELSKQILGANESNTVAIVPYAANVVRPVNFTSNINDITKRLSDHSGYGGTSWGAGLNKACDNLKSRQDQNRQAYVILVTDGNPNDKQDYRENAIARLKTIENETGNKVKTYAVGICSSALTGLQSVATQEDMAFDAVSVKEFVGQLNNIVSGFMEKPKGGEKTITEEIADGFELLIDGSHPFTIGGVQYTSKTDIPSEVCQFSDDNRSFTVTIDELNEAGLRVSFYSKSNATGADSFIKSLESKTIETNELAQLQYRKILEANNEDGFIVADKDSLVSAASPTLNITSEKIILNKMANVDTVHKGDIVTYKLEVMNGWSTEVKNIVVRDYIPEGMTFVDFDAEEDEELGSTGIDRRHDSEENYVEFSGISVPARGSIELAIKVQVDVDDGTIQNQAQFGVQGIKDSIEENGRPIVNSNNVLLQVDTNPTAMVTTRWHEKDSNKQLKPFVVATEAKPAGTIPNYFYHHSEADDHGNVTHYFVTDEATAKLVTTRWVDENNSDLHPMESGVKPKPAGTIPGYEYVRSQADEEGNVIHHFTKAETTPQDLFTRWVDVDRDITDLNQDLKPQASGIQAADNFDDYTYVRSEVSGSGSMIHYYKKAETTPQDLFTRWVDVDKDITDLNQDLKPQASGIQAADNFDDYTYVRSEVDGSGNMIHYYKKAETTPQDLFTRWVDVDKDITDLNQDLKPQASGIQAADNFDDYTYVRSEVDGSGNMIHYYKKAETTPQDLFTRWVDVDKDITDLNQDLKPQASGIQAADNFDDYTYVRSEVDGSGNMIHYYKKAETTPQDLFTRWVDVDKEITDLNQDLKPQASGIQAAGSFDDYKYVRSETDGNGNEIHYFKKIEVTTTWVVKGSGEVLRGPEVGTKPAGTIPGYIYVESKADEDGNVTHYFEKGKSPDKPIIVPTDRPTEEPTDTPTENPSEGPSEGPSENLTGTPTDKPTGTPTDNPSEETSENPSDGPSENPSETPTDHPSEEPTEYPTDHPTDPTKGVTTKWRDPDTGEELKPPTEGNGAEPPGTIDGYYYDHTETDEDGDITHYFKKNPVDIGGTNPTTQTPPIAQTGEDVTTNYWMFALFVLSAFALMLLRKRLRSSEN